MNEEHPLDEEDFDLATTRPPLTMGLPHTLSCSLIAMGMFLVALYDTGDLIGDLMFDAEVVGAIAMVWSAAKVMLRNDYHGWDIFVAWVMLDFRCLDTREWGGAHISSAPLQSIYRCGWSPKNHDN